MEPSNSGSLPREAGEGEGEERGEGLKVTEGDLAGGDTQYNMQAMCCKTVHLKPVQFH